MIVPSALRVAVPCAGAVSEPTLTVSVSPSGSVSLLSTATSMAVPFEVLAVSSVAVGTGFVMVQIKVSDTVAVPSFAVTTTV